MKKFQEQLLIYGYLNYSVLNNVIYISHKTNIINALVNSAPSVIAVDEFQNRVQYEVCLKSNKTATAACLL